MSLLGILIDDLFVFKVLNREEIWVFVIVDIIKLLVGENEI